MHKNRFKGSGRPADSEKVARNVAKPADRRSGWSGRSGSGRFGWWAVALTAAIVATGMAYTELWEPVVHHLHHPLIPADFSQTLEDARVIGRGRLFRVYSDHAQLVTLPGYALLLAPVATAGRLLHLHQPWLLAGPFALATAWPALFGMDRLAAALGAGEGRRRVLLAAGAVAVWPTLVLWGHPEDVLAVGLCCLCLAAVIDGRWRAAGWFLGAALAAQLLALLVVPVVLAAAGRDRIRRVAPRAAAVPAVLAAAVVLPDLSAAWSALTNQPNYPLVDHPTPWILLSPSLGPGTVAAGPARLLGLLVAACCGVAAYRSARRGAAGLPPARLVWLAAVAFSARCLFEAVMDPYYVMPAVVLTLVLASREHGSRSAVAGLVCLALTVDTAESFGMWTYWLVMAVLIGVAMAAVAAPGRDPATRAGGDRRRRAEPSPALTS